MPVPTPVPSGPAESDYELIDFGEGKKLERFGCWRIARPCPAARRVRPTWRDGRWPVDVTFEKSRTGAGQWSGQVSLADPWLVRLEGLTLELRRTPAGQLGVFPEQRIHWPWIRHQVLATPRPLRILNLFAYTGGSTLAAAAGAHVVHVDAARNVVDWARRNAGLSGLAAASIQWITDDARKFVSREIRRGHRYEGVILDPPSYGHGPHGEEWRIDRDLPPLLRDCRQLLAEHPAFVLMTCHSPGWGPAELQAALDSLLWESCAAGSRGQRLWLTTRAGRRLAAGAAVRWSSGHQP